jgi:hypothetical protein
VAQVVQRLSTKCKALRNLIVAPSQGTGENYNECTSPKLLSMTSFILLKSCIMDWEHGSSGRAPAISLYLVSHKAGALLLEPHLQSILLWLF